MEGYMLQNGKKGEVFYSTKSDRGITASAIHYKRKVLTERVIVIESKMKIPTATRIIKITIIE